MDAMTTDKLPFVSHVIGVILLTCQVVISSGCACIHLKDAGVRVELPREVAAAHLYGQNLVLDYQADIARRSEGLIGTVVGTKNRTVVLTLVRPNEKNYFSAPARSLPQKERESLRMCESDTVPVLNQWEWSPSDAVFAANRVVILRPNGRTSAEASFSRAAQGNYPVNVVFHQGSVLTENRYRIPYLEYRTWWSIPSQVVSYPFAFAFDVVTFPIQLIYVLHDLSVIK